jgi:glucose-6-phosphate isomerase
MDSKYSKENRGVEKMIKLNLKNALDEKEIFKYQKKVTEINKMIEQKTGLGHEFLGWVDYPKNYNQEEVEKIIRLAKYVRENFEVLVVAGIGGSYLGARAAIDALGGLYFNRKLEIIYLGNTFSPTYTAQVLTYLEDKKFAINVISKSGTTTETSIAFRLVKKLLERKIGKLASKKAIFATTDKSEGALKKLAVKEGYETFVLPDDIGGRYSVFTPVGLFPLACAGYDIKEFLNGALDGYLRYSNPPLKDNPCYMYACARDYMYRYEEKSVELFVQYEPQFIQISEWLKQLFGESEGKHKRGLFPASASFSTDLHSLGQFIQDGTPLLFETIIRVFHLSEDISIPNDEDNLDGLNYLEGKKLSYINEQAFLGTLKAHHEDGNVPCLVLELETMNEGSLGELLYFFMRACAMSAYLLEINPFDQPGVEIYKKNMFHLLGKKGY